MLHNIKHFNTEASHKLGLLLQSIKFQPEWAHLPALVCSAIVGIVFGDMGVDAAQGQLFVWGR